MFENAIKEVKGIMLFSNNMEVINTHEISW